MKRKKVLLTTVLILFSAASTAGAAEPSAREFMKGLHIFGDSSSLIMEFVMQIRSPQGEKERILNLHMDRSSEDQKLLIQIKSPAFLSSMKYLSRRERGKETRWLKTSRGVRRLSARNNSDSLFGSDFTVEDLSLAELDSYTWSYEGDAPDGDVRIRAVPLYDSPGFDYKVFTVGQSDRLLKQIDYYGGGALIKQYRLIESMSAGDSPFPRVVTMKTLKDQTETVLTVRSVEFVPSLQAGVFNKGNL